MSATPAWLVVSGEYSNYYVECVCVTADEAQAVADKLNALLAVDEEDDDWRRKYEVQRTNMATVADAHREVTLYLHAKLPDGPVEESTSSHIGTNSADDRACRVQWKPMHRILSVCGTDHERVRKVFSEQRAMRLAEIEGIA